MMKPTFQSPAIRAITFDLDDTLFDFQARMLESAGHVVKELCLRRPGAGPSATVDLFDQLWREAAAEARAASGPINWHEVRRINVERFLETCGWQDAALVEELTALYFLHRHAPAAPFEDAAEAIRLLSQHFPLGIITNANTRIDNLGLGQHFRVVLSPAVADYGKPDPRIFHRAAHELGCEPAELLHVGDHRDDDVTGALQSGCQAAWYSRSLAYGEIVVTEWETPEGPHSCLVFSDHRHLARWVLAQTESPVLP